LRERMVVCRDPACQRVLACGRLSFMYMRKSHLAP
jgi:hypothetical protein